jgi:sigma-B regulation protein RsbU (phosphoserine phosphatase)
MQDVVRDIMMPAPITVRATTPVAEAAQLMAERNIGAVVVTKDGRVAGIFTERDLLRRVVGTRDEWAHRPVEQFMTAAPSTIDSAASWDQAMQIMDERGVRHLPVLEAGKLVGMLSVRDLLRHRARYLESLVQDRTVELVTRNEALTEREREMTRHLEVAGRIQQRLLPDCVPDLEPIRFACSFHPLQQVTGDYYDFMRLGPDRLAVLIADVSGHGVPAAFVSVLAKTCFAAYCQGLESPAAMLGAMNRRLHDLIEAEKFVTMFIAVVDRRTLEFTYARAGHPMPLWFRAATGEVTALDAGGVMIGLAPQSEFVEQQVQLQPGDKVLLYTDGVAECRSPSGALFGLDALEAFLRRNARRPRRELLAALEDELERFRDDGPFQDDVTMIVVEVAA